MTRINRPHVTRGILVEEDFRRRDALPWPVKEVYLRAPINQGCMTPEDVRMLGVAKARAEAIVACAERGIIECRRAYGEDHPCIERLTRAMTIGVRMGSASPRPERAARPDGRRAPWREPPAGPHS